MDTEVRHDAEGARYELLVDGEVVGHATYHSQDDDGPLVFTHTEVSPGRRGRGLGAVLVRGVLDDVRRRGRTVVPRCWYLAEFIEAHPDYQDLLDASAGRR